MKTHKAIILSTIATTMFLANPAIAQTSSKQNVPSKSAQSGAFLTIVAIGLLYWITKAEKPQQMPPGLDPRSRQYPQQMPPNFFDS